MTAGVTMKKKAQSKTSSKSNDTVDLVNSGMNTTNAALEETKDDKHIHVSSEILNDPTLAISNREVAKARQAVRNGTDRVYRIYSDGIFDLFHIGHMNVLKQAKFALGNPDNVHLIVGVCSDNDTRENKGTLVIDENIRAETVKHCKWVDQVIPNCPWVITDEFIKEHQIDFVAHDAIPYVSGDSEDVYSGVKKMGKFLATERTSGISTTDIIIQIVKDYDEYVVRNLKRGVDKKQLNVGRTWEIRAVAHEKGKNLDKNIDKIQHEKEDLVNTIQILKEEIRNSGVVCGLKRRRVDDEEEANNRRPAGTKVLKETMNVLKHSWKLTGAIFETSLSLLSYFNIFSYIDKCRQTKEYQKHK